MWGLSTRGSRLVAALLAASPGLYDSALSGPRAPDCVLRVARARLEGVQQGEDNDLKSHHPLGPVHLPLLCPGKNKDKVCRTLRLVGLQATVLALLSSLKPLSLPPR